ncbi:unnamed protein product, partial [Staurois parvus]
MASFHSHRACAAQGAHSTAISADHRSTERAEDANQCHLSVLPISATYQCQSVPPISARQCLLSVPPNSASQCCLSVPYISAAFQCSSVMPVNAHQCH